MKRLLLFQKNKAKKENKNIVYDIKRILTKLILYKFEYKLDLNTKGYRI